MENMRNENTIEQFGYKQELNRSLTIWDLIIYGLIFMVPIAPFGIYGYVSDISKGMVALAYAIGVVGMIFTAFSYAKLSEDFPISGSVYSYASKGINPTIGFLSGWLIILDYILVPALLYVVSAAALHGVFPKIPVIAWGIAFILINTVINVLGVELTAKFNKVVLILELMVLGLFIVVGIYAIVNHVGGAEFSFNAFYNPKYFNLNVVMNAVSIAVLSFLGFDGISTLAEEAKGGRKTIGRATVLALFCAGFLFILQTWIAAMIWPNFKAFSNLDTAFYQVAQRAGGKWLMLTCSLATAFAWGIANSLAAQAAISRVLYSMSRDKFLPAFLAKVHPKFKTPYVATIFIAIISAFLVVIYSEKIASLTSLVNFGALSAFMVLHLTVIIYFGFKKKDKSILSSFVSPILGFLIIFYVWINLESHAKIVGGWWFVIGVIYYLILTLIFKRKPTNLEV